MSALSNNSSRTVATVFNEWFLSNFLGYLNVGEIVRLDSAICNKSDRPNWLECIAKDIGHVSTKFQSCITNDATIKWCSMKKIKFKHLNMNCSDVPCSITACGASLLSMCCINLTELRLKFYHKEPCLHVILNKIGQRCSKLIRIKIYSSILIVNFNFTF